MCWGSFSALAGPRRAPRCLWDAGRQAGRQRKTKMATACSASLHVAMSDVSTADVKDILNKMSGVFSFPSVFHFPLSVLWSQKIKTSLLLSLSLSLCVHLPSAPPPPPSLSLQQRAVWFGKTKAPLVQFDPYIIMSVDPDGWMTTVWFEKVKTGNLRYSALDHK